MELTKFNLVHTKDTDVVVMKLPQKSVEYPSDLFSKMTKTLLLNPARFHVLDFEKVDSFPWQLIPVIKNYDRTLSLNQKHLAFLNLRSNHVDDLKGFNLENKFSCIQSINELSLSLLNEKFIQRRRSLKKVVNGLFLNAFIEATAHTLGVQARNPCRALKPYPKSSQRPLFKSEVVAQMDIGSHKFSGSLLIHFTERRFLKIYNRMVGEDNPKLTQEVADASREILNIIYGCAKHSLKEIGHNTDANFSIPTLLDADQIIDLYEEENHSFFIPFQSRVGVFCIEIIIEEFFSNEH